MRRDFLIGSLLVLITVAVFSPVLQAGFVQWDDDINIYNNPHIQKLNWPNLHWMFTDCSYTPRYRPLNWLSWAILWNFFGANAFPFHAIALVLQAANAVLIFVLLRKILRLASPANDNQSHVGSICAGLAALLWTVHPMRAEAVAWANGQIYTQSLFFLLLSLLCYLRAIESANPLKIFSYWLSVFLFALAMLTYPTGVGFVVVLWVLDIYLLRRISSAPAKWLAPETRSVLLEKIPFVLITAILAIVAVAARATLSGTWAVEYQSVGLPWLARVSQAFYIWAYYLWRPFWPVNLSPSYTQLISFHPMDWPFLLSAAAIFGGTILFFLKRNRWPLLFALWICHLALLVPMLGLTEHPHYSNDRYNYIASLLWSGLIAFALIKIWSQSRWRIIAVTACVAFAGIFALMSFEQTGIWKNSAVLFRSIIARLGDDPYRSNLYWRLGNYFSSQNRTAEAVFNYSEALKIRPGFIEVRNNLAAIYLGQGKFDEAAAQYSAILKNDPKSSLAHYNLGTILDQQGKTDEAILHYHAAVESNPKNAEAHNNLGIALSKIGKMDEALDHVLTAARLDPNSPPANFSAGTALMQNGKLPEAIEHLSAAVRLKPDFVQAHYNFGNALAMAGRLPEALPHFAEVVRLQPKVTEGYMPLGMALAQLGKTDEAVKTYRQGLALAEADGKKELAAQIQSRLQEFQSGR